MSKECADEKLVTFKEQNLNANFPNEAIYANNAKKFAPFAQFAKFALKDFDCLRRSHFFQNFARIGAISGLFFD
jgi:hypothetical protein